MVLTYYTLLELESGTSERKGQIVGELLSYIDESDYLSHASSETRLVFNENALKGVYEFIQSYDENEDCSIYMVAINEDESIHDYSDQEIDQFEDCIEVFPNLDESRVDSITLEFKRSTDQRQSGFANSEEKISFERAGKIVNPIVNDIEDHSEDGDLIEIKRLLPTKDKLIESTSAKLGIDDDSQMAEIIISSSESSLAIMHTLMSEELDQIEDLDIDQINRLILKKVASSDQAISYLSSRNILQSFLAEVNSRKEEIETEYDRQMQLYLDEMIEKLKAEYRAKVPDETALNLKKFYQSIEPQYNSISQEHNRSLEELNLLIMKDFTSADRSPAMKALRKFLTLKEQIRQSALRSIERLHSTESRQVEDLSRNVSTLNDSDKEELETLRRQNQALEENARLREIEMNRLKEIESARESELEQKRVEEQEKLQTPIKSESIAYSDVYLNESKPSDDHAAESAEDASEGMVPEEDNGSDDLSSIDSEQPKDLEDQSKVELPEDEHVESNESDMKQIQVASVNLDDLEDQSSHDLLDEEDFFEDRDSIRTDKTRKKMSLPVKIGLVLAGVIVSAAIVFFGVKMLNNQSSHGSNQVQTTATDGQSQQIENTIFNVGDVLTITGSEGESLDVTIKEFKSDGSAVAEDANKDKWLITRDQMIAYADAHPDQFKKTQSSEESKSSKDQEKSESSKSTTTSTSSSKEDSTRSSEATSDKS